ncbi:hypothetical protein ACFYU8_25045 [Brevibacillus sp. NPDC003359]|uniref:hypothetical protein n=1 Tax=unclassified Brevibacillus TaxID=2684853 RepID=UPI00368D5FE4
MGTASGLERSKSKTSESHDSDVSFIFRLTLLTTAVTTTAEETKTTATTAATEEETKPAATTAAATATTTTIMVAVKIFVHVSIDIPVYV